MASPSQDRDIRQPVTRHISQDKTLDHRVSAPDTQCTVTADDSAKPVEKSVGPGTSTTRRAGRTTIQEGLSQDSIDPKEREKDNDRVLMPVPAHSSSEGRPAPRRIVVVDTKPKKTTTSRRIRTWDTNEEDQTALHRVMVADAGPENPSSPRPIRFRDSNEAEQIIAISARHDRPSITYDRPAERLGSTRRRVTYYDTGYRSVESWHDSRDDPSFLYHSRYPPLIRPRQTTEQIALEARNRLALRRQRGPPPTSRGFDKINRTISINQPSVVREALPPDPKEQSVQQIAKPESESDAGHTFSQQWTLATSDIVKKSFNSLSESEAFLYKTPEDLAVGWKEILENPGTSGKELDASFNHHKTLGSGAFGLVDEVSAPAGVGTLARKRIRVPRRKFEAARTIEFIVEEIENMKSLVHPHIVRIFGSYQANPSTTKHSYCLLMHPVGDDDLASFLEDECGSISSDPESEDAITKSAWIMKWFTCLPGALAYMHSQQIHHEDIKPTNIIHKGEHIYFTDFSSSRRCESAHATSTANPARASPLFAAPEALLIGDDSERHGSKTDVFSLGLVFVEMLTVLGGNEIEDLHKYLERNNGFGEDDEFNRKQYHRAVDLMDGWFTSEYGSAFFKQCIKPMLNEERASRPSAEEVVRLVQEGQPWGETMACPCKNGARALSATLEDICE